MEFLCPSEEHLTALKNQVITQGAELDTRVSFQENAEHAEGAGVFAAGDIKRVIR